MPDLLKAAPEMPTRACRLAALKALYHQAGAAELPALLKILVKARSAAESQAAEDALGACAARAGPRRETWSLSKPSTALCRRVLRPT